MAFSRSTSRSRGGPWASSVPSSSAVASTTRSTARSKAAWLARDGSRMPESFRTYCSADARISSGVAALAGIIFSLVWIWAPRSVRVEGDVVVVERNWAGPVEVALRPDAPPPRRLAREELRGLRKQAGSNFGAVRYGTYASDALGPFQLYGSRVGQHWLLETAAGKVVVVPDDQEAFEAWARGRSATAP